MKWNNGKEKAKFEQEQEQLRKEYLAAGMTEEQIKKMHDYDLSVFNSNRRECEHTQRLEFDDAEFDDKETDNPLFKKFLSAISVTPEYSDSSRYGWIEEIENDNLAKVLKKLPKSDLEVLTEWLVDGFSVTEIAKKQGIHKSNISRQIMRLKKIFEEIL